MNIVPTIESLRMVEDISTRVKTWHHHYHILYDIGRLFEGWINYVEIGCAFGASSILMLQRPKTNVVAIDCGNLVKTHIVLDNVEKNNPLNNHFVYLHEDSQKLHTRELLQKELVGGIDILFIDGDHEYASVVSDFMMYHGMVKSGGYIVFDDYHDEGDPEVSHAVNDIVAVIKGYDILWTFENTLNAYPQTMKEGNCFIICKQ